MTASDRAAIDACLVTLRAAWLHAGLAHAALKSPRR